MGERRTKKRGRRGGGGEKGQRGEERGGRRRAETSGSWAGVSPEADKLKTSMVPLSSLLGDPLTSSLALSYSLCSPHPLHLSHISNGTLSPLKELAATPHCPWDPSSSHCVPAAVLSFSTLIPATVPWLPRRGPAVGSALPTRSLQASSEVPAPKTRLSGPSQAPLRLPGSSVAPSALPCPAPP